MRPNADAADPQALLRELVRRPVAVPEGPPHRELSNPTHRMARRAVLNAALDARIGEDAAAALLFASNEALSNARQHGRVPIQMSVRASPGRVHLVIHDSGPGPHDPAVGLIGTPGRASGLWLAHQLLDVHHEVSDHGYAVHLQVQRGDTGR